jgi:hypothetical protein
VYAFRDLVAGETVGGGGLHTTSALDPSAVLAAHPTARDALGIGALVRIAFWMAFWMAQASNAEARATDNTRLGGWTGDGRHNASLRSLPWVAPEPLWLATEDRGGLLGGTPVG